MDREKAIAVWKNTIENGLKNNLNLFVEILMYNNETHGYLPKITKAELLYLIKSVFDDNFEEYIVSTRYVDSPDNKYYIVASPIQKKLNN